MEYIGQRNASEYIREIYRTVKAKDIDVKNSFIIVVSLVAGPSLKIGKSNDSKHPNKITPKNIGKEIGNIFKDNTDLYSLLSIVEWLVPMSFKNDKLTKGASSLNRAIDDNMNILIEEKEDSSFNYSETHLFIEVPLQKETDSFSITHLNNNNTFFFGYLMKTTLIDNSKIYSELKNLLSPFDKWGKFNTTHYICSDLKLGINFPIDKILKNNYKLLQLSIFWKSGEERKRKNNNNNNSQHSDEDLSDDLFLSSLEFPSSGRETQKRLKFDKIHGIIRNQKEKFSMGILLGTTKQLWKDALIRYISSCSPNGDSYERHYRIDLIDCMIRKLSKILSNVFSLAKDTHLEFQSAINHYLSNKKDFFPNNSQETLLTLDTVHEVYESSTLTFRGEPRTRIIKEINKVFLTITGDLTQDDDTFNELFFYFLLLYFSRNCPFEQLPIPYKTNGGQQNDISTPFRVTTWVEHDSDSKKIVFPFQASKEMKIPKKSTVFQINECSTLLLIEMLSDLLEIVLQNATLKNPNLNSLLRSFKNILLILSN